MNPYRDAFYQRQAEWHGYEDASKARERHDLRARYFEWYTRGWLPGDREAPILDVGCGSGQLLYFLASKGYRRAKGIDLDHDQVALAKQLGLDAEECSAQEHLERSPAHYDLIVILDVIEHLTREELFPFMEAVVGHLKPGGRLIASVPNAESPDGLRCTYTDITHEAAYTPVSFEQMLFCHGLRLEELRDPWPAPISPWRWAYLGLVRSTRFLESIRLRALGLNPPAVWSNTMWVLASKPSEQSPSPGSRSRTARSRASSDW